MESGDALNPFTYAVESIRFALYLEFNGMAFLVAVACLLAFFVLAVYRTQFSWTRN